MLLALVASLVSLAAGSRLLLYGDRMHGFLEIRPISETEAALHFAILDGDPAKMRFSVHAAIAPRDSANSFSQCSRCKKTPHLVRGMPLNDTTLPLAQIVGNTVVLESTTENPEVLACGTVVLPEFRLLKATFHQAPVHGTVHVIPMKSQLRILPDFKYDADYETEDPRAEVLDWAFVKDCEAENVVQSSDGTELGVDSRSTLTFDTSGANLTISAFALFRASKPFACAPLIDVEPRTISAGDFSFTQPHVFASSMWTGKGKQPSEVHIRDDCFDVATEAIHRSLEKTPYYPSMAIFGSESLILKAIVPSPSDEPQFCLVLRPHFARPVASAAFRHPIVGSLSLVDTDDAVLVTGSLKHLFSEESAARATVQVSPRFAESAGCPEYTTGCADCVNLADSALIAGHDDPDVSLAGVLPYFQLSKMRSVSIDLSWTKVCANLTLLPNGAISARANVYRYSPVSAPIVATIVLMEYPANGYTEVVVNKKAKIGSVSLHERPVDMAVTGGPPCGELTIGPQKNASWLEELNKILQQDENDATLTINDFLITGNNSVLSSSLLLVDKDNDKNVYCGSFEMVGAKTTSFVAMFNDSIQGYVKFEQAIDESSSLPTLVSYHIEEGNETDIFGRKDAPLAWSVVSDSNMTCDKALIFNPTQAKEEDCDISSAWQCPLGKRTTFLIPKRRVTVAEPRLPLQGPFSVAQRSIRLNTTKGTICAHLEAMDRASLYWTTRSNRSLSDLQDELVNRMNLQPFQISIGYNRELTGSLCSTFKISLLAPPEKLSAILNSFDVQGKKFQKDEELICEVVNTTTTAPKAETPKPARSASQMSLFVVLFAFSILFLTQIL